MGAKYEFRQMFEKAQEQRDPELAPHVRFRRLAPGNAAVALDFIRDFGPLHLTDMTRNPIVWIDLNDFWRRHARFVAVVRLYEALHDCKGLLQALVDIADNISSLDGVEPAKLGMIPDTHKDSPYIRYAYINSSDDYRKVNQFGDPMYDHRDLRDWSRDLIRAELILQTHEGIRSGWEELDENEGLGFRPTRVVTSLWAAMWEMFGLDTWRGFGWRSCRICGKYFYPLQLNSECCNPEHQALWSKREYARRRRFEESACHQGSQQTSKPGKEKKR
jgi:hypothetical protein